MYPSDNKLNFVGRDYKAGKVSKTEEFTIDRVNNPKKGFKTRLKQHKAKQKYMNNHSNKAHDQSRKLPSPQFGGIITIFDANKKSKNYGKVIHTSQKQPRTSRNKRRKPNPHKSNIPCIFHRTRGGCRYGNNCDYSHSNRKRFKSEQTWFI